jgi:hypothetical protein
VVASSERANLVELVACQIAAADVSLGAGVRVADHLALIARLEPIISRISRAGGAAAECELIADYWRIRAHLERDRGLHSHAVISAGEAGAVISLPTSPTARQILRRAISSAALAAGSINRPRLALNLLHSARALVDTNVDHARMSLVDASVHARIGDLDKSLTLIGEGTIEIVAENFGYPLAAFGALRRAQAHLLGTTSNIDLGINEIERARELLARHSGHAVLQQIQLREAQMLAHSARFAADDLVVSVALEEMRRIVTMYDTGGDRLERALSFIEGHRWKG